MKPTSKEELILKTEKSITALLVCLLCCTFLSNAQAAKGQLGHRVPKHHHPVLRQYIWNAGQTKAIGQQLDILVILAQFSDVPLTYSHSNFESQLKKKKASAEQYLSEQLGVEVNITVVGPVSVPQTRKYYGENTEDGNDSHPGEFIADACKAADDIVDFSLFDSKKSGFADNVHVIYSGEDEAQQEEGKNTDFLWSHSWTLAASYHSISLDGVYINNYSCSSELFRIYKSDLSFDDAIAPIGTFCHEYLHSLGLTDMYDTDGVLSGGLAAGLWGKTAIMDSGNYNDNGNTPPNLNAIDLDLLGVMNPMELEIGSYTLKPIGTREAMSYKITNPEDSCEFYLFECRKQEGWDKFIGGNGMLVYHVDKSENILTPSEVYGIDLPSVRRWNLYNEVNCRPDHQCADLIEADLRKDESPTPLSMNDITGIFFPYVGAYTIGGSSNIKIPFWNGKMPSLYLTDIKLDSVTGEVSFNVKDMLSPMPVDPTDPPKNEDMLYIIMQQEDDGVCHFKVNNSVSSSSTEWFFNDKPIENPQAFIPQGTGTVRAEVTWQDGSVDYLFKNIR